MVIWTRTGNRHEGNEGDRRIYERREWRVVWK